MSRKLRVAFVAASMIGAAALVLADCDDVSPVTYVPPTVDAEVPDHVDISRVEACRACVVGDGGKCKAQYDSCVQMDPRCPGYVECLTASFCWEQFNPRDFGALPPCAAGCFQEAGISGLNEILGAAAPGYFCIVNPKQCGSVCLSSSDGGPADAGGP